MKILNILWGIHEGARSRALAPIHLPPKFYYYYYYFGGRATSNVSNGSLLLQYGERGGFMACCILRGGMVGIVVDWVKLVV